MCVTATAKRRRRQARQDKRWRKFKMRGPINLKKGK